MVDVRSHIHPQRRADEPIVGVCNPLRLAAVMAAELDGHLGDTDLNAAVATLRIACRVPIAVVNIVSHNLQTYPAEVGVGAPCTAVPDALSFCAEVVDTGRALAVSDAGSHPVYSMNPMVLDGVIGAYAGVPLVDDGVVLGSVSIFHDQAREFTDEDLEVLRHQAQLVSSVLALRRSSRTDVLTGLPNRRLFLHRLDRALARLERHGGFAAVMFLDINGFKDLNDTFGHDVGDQVLIEIAERLTAVMRVTDTLARFGGDEFVVVCEDVINPADIERMAVRMLSAANRTLVIDGQLTAVSMSIGIAMTDTAGADPDRLMRAADAAMYRAKRLGGSGWELAPSELAATKLPS